MVITSQHSPDERSVQGHRVAITGSQSGLLCEVKRALNALKVPTSLAGEPASLEAGLFSAAIVVESFDLDMGWWDTFEASWELEELVERMHSHLSSPSTILLVALSSEDDVHSRLKLRRELESFSHQAASVASMKAGIDMTVNVVELPIGLHQDLLVQRLTEYFVTSRSKLPSGFAFSIEDLEVQRLSSALLHNSL